MSHQPVNPGRQCQEIFAIWIQTPCLSVCLTIFKIRFIQMVPNITDFWISQQGDSSSEALCHTNTFRTVRSCWSDRPRQTGSRKCFCNSRPFATHSSQRFFLVSCTCRYCTGASPAATTPQLKLFSQVKRSSSMPKDIRERNEARERNVDDDVVVDDDDKEFDEPEVDV